VNINNFFFLLGADDPEMERISEILNLFGAHYEFARKDGERVHSGNAYHADAPLCTPTEHTKVVFIECETSSLQMDIRIDHHRPGDPGFELGASHFFEASSLGQLFKLLHLSPSQNDLVIAAMDHCFSDAMHNRCPSVSRKEVRDKKIQSLYKRVNQVMAAYTDAVSAAQTTCIGSQEVSVLEKDLGIGYSFDYLIAQIVAVEIGSPVILLSRSKEGERYRLHLCGGNVEENTIKVFTEVWGPAHGIDDLYGSPARGYAGGYLSGTFDIKRLL
jgi:hypothetical protein